MKAVRHASDINTIAELKEEIDTGLTGDKNVDPDPGMAEFGKCDEAAGSSATPERVALARKQEKEIGRIATSEDRIEVDIPILLLLGVMASIGITTIVFYFTQ